MTKVRQSEHTYLTDHTVSTLPLPTTLFSQADANQDDSPDSCITENSIVINHSATSSSGCSTSTGMDKLLYQNGRTSYPGQELGCCSSDDDGSNSSVAISSENMKGEKQSPSSRLSTNIMMQEQETLVKLSSAVPEKLHNDGRELTLETSNTMAEIAASKDLRQTKTSRGTHDKRMIATRSSQFGRISNFFSSDQEGSHERSLKSSKTQDHSLVKSNSVSKPYLGRDLVNLQTSSKGLYVKPDDTLNAKRYGSQGPASQAVLRTFPSPGTPSRSSFSGIPTSMNHSKISAREFARDARSVASRTLPSKWDDAEKWLLNASPSHHQSRSPGRPCPGSTKAFNAGQEEKISSSSRRQPMQTSERRLSNADKDLPSGIPVPLPSYDSLQETVSDSEVFNSHDDECRIFVRSNSQKPADKPCAQTKTGRKSVSSMQAHQLQLMSSPSDLHLHQRVQICPHPKPPTRTAVNSGKAANDFANVQRGNVENAFWRFPNDSLKETGRSEMSGLQTEVFTQDIYADRVVETFKQGACPSEASNRLVVHAPKNKWAAPMRDAATEISPKVSRRDMGTQITPLGSSRTSQSTTPMRDNSPIRPNTPARKSASWNDPGSCNRLELDSCHLAKLEYRDVQQKQNACQDCVSETSITPNWRKNEEEQENAMRPSNMDMVEANKNFMQATATAWEEAERSKHMTKYAREEARIEAWELHQKAKAEAELKKLEMKLEKLRLQATEKMMNKVAAAHRRAEEMRAAARSQQAEHLARASERANHMQKSGYLPESLGVCFTGLP